MRFGRIVRRMVSGPAPVYDTLYESHGLSDSHQAMLDLIPPGSRVLDVGCAGGYLAAEMMKRGCTVVGLEKDESAVEAARGRGVDARQHDLEAEPFDADGYDVVVFGDILEHLRDPLPVLQQAHPAGLVVVSLPNAAHWTVRRQLAAGKFPKEDSGIFDRTHLRWFTLDDARDLAYDANFDVIGEAFTSTRLPLDGKVPPLRRFRQSWADRWPELFAFQFVLKLRPVSYEEHHPAIRRPTTSALSG